MSTRKTHQPGPPAIVRFVTDKGGESAKAWVDLGHEWVAEVMYVLVEGEPEIVGILVAPALRNDDDPEEDPSPRRQLDASARGLSLTTGPLTSTLLRQIKLGELDGTMRSQAAAVVRGTRTWPIRPHRVASTLATTMTPRTKPGRRGHDDAYYLPIAARYVELIEQGVRKPVDQIAEERGDRPTQVRDLVHQCRSRRLLTRGTRGRPSGTLTEKALQLLTEMNDSAPSKIR